MSWKSNLAPEAQAFYNAAMKEIHAKLVELYPGAEEVVITIHEGKGSTWVLRNCPTSDAARVVRFGLEYLDGVDGD